MATTKPKELEFKIGPGLRVMLDELKRTANYEYGGLLSHQKNLKSAQKYRDDKAKELAEAEKSVRECEANIRNDEKQIAEIMVDIGKFHVPEEIIKRYWPDFNGHDVAEWLQY